PQLRAHPPLQPGRHGRAALAVQGLGQLGVARHRRHGDVRHPGALDAQAAAGHHDGHPSGRRHEHARDPALAHRHAGRGRVLPARRHPAVRAPGAARRGLSAVAGIPPAARMRPARDPEGGPYGPPFSFPSSRPGGERATASSPRQPRSGSRPSLAPTQGPFAGPRARSRRSILYTAGRRLGPGIQLFSDDPKPPTRIGPLARAILIAGGAFIACMLAQLVSMQQPQALLVWPASGVAFAAGQRWGPQWTLPAAIGAALWSALYFDPAPVPLAAGIVTIAGPLVALGLMSRLERWKPAEYRLESAIRHIVAIIVVAAPIDAILASIGGT